MPTPEENMQSVRTPGRVRQQEPHVRGRLACRPLRRTSSVPTPRPTRRVQSTPIASSRGVARHEPTSTADSSRHAGYRDLRSARLPMRSCAASACSSAPYTSSPPRTNALTPRPPCGSEPVRCPAAWTRCCMPSYGAGLPRAGRALELPGAAGAALVGVRRPSRPVTTKRIDAGRATRPAARQAEG
jgi:hypothetical protein